ncbi:hypothetical protein BT96DRAFT_994744 [Gymnopus androsaceus JB14]|uniref:Uncharacterized protein n=1 Tax=Gymnopus androsaceus JB14 TaxID=1447944 RepID=A0A6A4HKM0_9AGAR|nr:hypothetical protein BT96DRAFT_994744 [Gymnopus androsaceus JB14]
MVSVGWVSVLTGSGNNETVPIPVGPTSTASIPDKLIDPVLRGLSASDTITCSAPPVGQSEPELPRNPTQPPPPPPSSSPFGTASQPSPTPSVDDSSEPLSTPLPNSPSQLQSAFHVFLFVLQEDGVVEGVVNKSSRKRKVQPWKKVPKVAQVEVSGIGKENIPPLEIVLLHQQPAEVAQGRISRERVPKLLGGPETIDACKWWLGIGKYKSVDDGEGIDKLPAKRTKIN